MLVLVVDDDTVARRMLSGVLARSGFDVVTAANGDEAFDILRDSVCQMVVCDWEMPGMNGLDLCRAVRCGVFSRYVYFILLTSHGRDQDVIDGLAAGADDFVRKPFNPAEIVARLNSGRRLLALETAEMTIFALARLAESRDPDTGAHLERVRSYCRLIASHLKRSGAAGDEVDDEFVRLIFQTSPLHDIGKVAIPDSVLLKAGPLTREEFEIMKMHTVYGAQTLDAAIERYPSAPFLHMARDIALRHHEKFDGSGYPGGLAGADIPLCARIVAVADVYDALTSRRVYKDACTHEQSRRIILEGRGTHFDPVLVDTFLACEQGFIDIRGRFADPGTRAAA